MTETEAVARPLAEAAIEACDLTKVYRLYERPKDRLLDLVGVGRGRRVVTEHHALDGVSLTVRRGERVGVIGRNGAGKSTFLKLVSGVMEPTSGTLHVAGAARALLEIGTGFHLDFTGRDNVRAYLAQMALSESEMKDLIPSIVEFAEVEEYVDQPLKTYSTGMRARLMFATSTALAPELLVLDEVLGVGDAYFTRKSFDRIAQMCEGGSTLLIVSHDMYAVSRIADRIVWLERGRVVFDGAPSDAVAAYEASIRDQEEQRLRNKALLSVHGGHRPVAALEDAVYLELAVADGYPGPVPVSRLALEADGGMLAELIAADDEGVEHVGTSRLVLDQSCWGEPAEWLGRRARPLAGHGSPFRNGPAILAAPSLVTSVEAGSVDLVVEHASEAAAGLKVRAFVRGRHVFSASLAGGTGWRVARERLDVGSRPADDALGSAKPIGTGRVEIEDVRLLGPDGEPALVMQHGDPFRLEIDYVIRDTTMAEHCDVLVSVLRNGVDTLTRIFTRDLFFDGVEAQSGTVRLKLEHNPFGCGEYSLAVLIAEERYFERTDHRFYSVEPGVYSSIRNATSFIIKGTGVLVNGTGTIETGSWSQVST